jgi:dipeptidyl-peptidase-4
MKITTEDVARFPRPGTAIPGKIAFAPDGRAVTFLASAKGDLARELYQVDLETGARSLVLGRDDVGGGATDANVSREEALRRERERLRETGITHYEWAEAAPVLLAPVRGELFVRRDGRARAVAKAGLDARLSRDGETVVFARDGELFAVASSGGPERRLTTGAEPGVTNGLAEFAAQEEMGRRAGFWISPDGKLVAFQRVDERLVPVFRIPHLASQDPLEAEEHRYPFAGAENVRWKLGVVSIDGGETRWLDTSGFEYLARVDWTRDGKLLVQLQTRDQRTLELREYAPSGESRTLLVERADTWVNLHDDLRPLDGGALLWASERSGTKQLHVVRAGETRALTSGGAVDRVVGADERSVVFTGWRDSPRERHLFRVPLAGGEPERLTREPGFHDGVLSSDGSALAIVGESARRAPSVVVRARGRELVVHEPESVDLPAPEFFSFSSRDSVELHAALYRPSTTPAPLVVSVYGGPHVQMVQDAWSLAVDLRAQLLAQRGFAVLKVDNRGSARRSVAFEGAIHRRMGSVEVRDQVDGVRKLVERGIAREDRVGVYGWSYGGYMTLLCLALAPDVFKAGVSGAPVVEWEGYDTHYTERYMETPHSNPDGYREASVLTHAAKIRGALLLVHGMIDENVHFRHSARLMDAMVKAGTPHDVLLFPNERHMPRGERDRASLEAKIADWLAHHLMM